MTSVPLKRVTNLHEVPKCRVVQLDPPRYLKLHEDGLLPIDHPYTEAQKHTLFQHDYRINCHLLASSRRGRISTARPLELMNQKTCHGSINLTKPIKITTASLKEMQTIHSPLVNETELVIMLNQVAYEILVLLGNYNENNSGHMAFARYSLFPTEIIIAEDVEMRIKIKVHAG